MQTEVYKTHAIGAQTLRISVIVILLAAHRRTPGHFQKWFTDGEIDWTDLMIGPSERLRGRRLIVR